VLNRLAGRGGSPGVGGLEGEGDTEGEGEGEYGCEGAPGRVLRTTGGGRPLGSGCDFEGFNGEWVDRGGGGGSFDFGSGEPTFLEELLCAGCPMLDHRAASASSSEVVRCSLGICL